MPGASRAVPLNDLNHSDGATSWLDQERAPAAPDTVKDLLGGPVSGLKTTTYRTTMEQTFDYRLRRKRSVNDLTTAIYEPCSSKYY